MCVSDGPRPVVSSSIIDNDMTSWGYAIGAFGILYLLILFLGMFFGFCFNIRQGQNSGYYVADGYGCKLYRGRIPKVNI